MAIVYLTEQQSWVGKEADCLIVHVPERDADGKPSGKREKKVSIPLLKIEEVVVLGEITLSTPALTTLLQAHIPIIYLNQYGRYLGTLAPALTRNSLLRLAQHSAHADLARKHTLARRFVAGKLRNMRTILLRYQRAQPDEMLTRAADRLKESLRTIKYLHPEIPYTPVLEHEIDAEGTIYEEVPTIKGDRMNGLGSLLGCEGAGSAAYFGTFARLIKCNWAHGFQRRVRRPPTDPVNAMLSYGYTLLAAQTADALAAVGFDPYIGFLHASRYGKPALALDLMEEFRPIIVDSVVLSLLNNQQLGPDSFVSELQSYRMTDTTKRLFLQKFEDRMQELVLHPTLEYKVSYRRAIELQARLLSKYLLGELPDYPPFAVR